ncbi:MAG TPA: hypothetical protein ENI79_01875 [Rhodospirillales bacterium]|nr:hypothetical protein [Rhodospirillales bacterium]
MRGILIGIGVVIAIIAGVVIYAFSSMDNLVQEAVEKYGSEVTQAKVTLNKVNLSPGEGKAALKGLNVGNPKGFETASAFKLGEISVKIDINSITGGGPGAPVILNEVLIGAPEVTYELNAGGSNIDAIQKNVNAYMAKLGVSSKAKDEGEGVKLIIENLIVRGGKVNVSASILKGESLSAKLPDIHLKDIGKDKGGATPGEVAEKLMTALNKAVSKAVADIGVGKTLDSLKTHLAGAAAGAVGGAVGGAVKGAQKTLDGAAGGAVDAVTEGAAGVGKKLKGLFGN